MSMNSVLGSALSGLRATQAGLDLVARNVANADSAGYTKKTLDQEALITGDKVSGVRIGDTKRQLDTLVQRQMWREASGAGYINAISRYTTHIDTMMGAPGSPAGLDGLFNAFHGSLEELAASPESFTERDQVLRNAQALAQTLNQSAADLQNLRLEAEQGIGDAVTRINELLAQISRINRDLGGSGAPSADLLDIRDRHVAELSQLIDLKVVERDGGQVALFTESGQLLLDLEPVELIFDERGTMAPESLYSANDDERGVGTVTLKSPSGQEIDLIRDNAIRSGELAALIELRDETLVQAQRQLDALADAMARSLSTYEIEGQALAGQDGYGLNPAALLAGDQLTLVIDDNGERKKVTIVNSKDPEAVAPNQLAAKSDGLVIAADLSDPAAAADRIAAELASAGIDVSVAADGGALQFADNGASVVSVVGHATATGFTGNHGSALPFFIDGDGNAPYSGSLDGTPQQIGFAGRIKVNPDLFEDNSRLVRYDDDTPIGDSTRPQDILRRLTGDSRTFPGHLGVSGTTDYDGTVHGFLQRIVAHQGAQAADAKRAKEAQDVVVALEERFTRESGVNVDEEMARLIELQTAFQANTRVVQAHREMMAMLLQL